MSEKNLKRETKSPSVPLFGLAAQGGDLFPETSSEVLGRAGAGNWEPFLDQYLRPCWREIVIACRSRGIPLDNADDLHQELMLRLIRDARFQCQVRKALAQERQDPDFCGNLPARYLKYRAVFLQSSRFRTYLKRVIQNLVWESVRQARRHPRTLEDSRLEVVEPWIEQSVSHSLERVRRFQALEQAVWSLREECETARTRGWRRLLDVLYLADVESCSAESIGHRYGISRTTVLGLLRKARARLVLLLAKSTGIAEPGELKRWLTEHVGELKQALTKVYGHSVA